MRGVPRFNPSNLPLPWIGDNATFDQFRASCFSRYLLCCWPLGDCNVRPARLDPKVTCPLIKMITSTLIDRDATHDLHRIVDDLFAQFQGTLTSGFIGPAVFNFPLTELTDYFDRTQMFGVRTGTPFSNPNCRLSIFCNYSRKGYISGPVA